MVDSIMMLLMGIGVSYLGYSPLSTKNAASIGFGLGIIGFLLRLAGPLLVFIGLVTLAVLMWNPSSQISSISP